MYNEQTEKGSIDTIEIKCDKMGRLANGSAREQVETGHEYGFKWAWLTRKHFFVPFFSNNECQFYSTKNNIITIIHNLNL